MRLKSNCSMAMDNVSSSILTIVWTMYHEIAMLIGLWKNGWIENCFVKS